MTSKTLVFGILVLFVYLPLLAILSILSTMARIFVSALAKMCRPDLSHFFTGYGLIYSIESIYRRPKVSVVVHMIFDGQIELEFVRRQFENRILNYCDAEGNPQYRRLRQTWTQFCGFTFWKTDSNFKLDDHVRLYHYYTDAELAVPSPCTEEDLRRVTGILISRPYVKDRSPWEMLLIPKYQFEDTDGRACSGSVLVLKIHHGLADGFSVFKLLNQLFQMRLSVPSAKFPKLSLLQSFMKTVIQVINFPFDVAKLLVLNSDEPNSWHITDKKLSRRYISFASDRIPVSTIKTIKNKHRVSYNSAVYAIAAGGVSRLMTEAGQKLPKSMSSFSPFPLPNHPGGLVNHWTALMFRFSPSIQSAPARLKEIATQFKDPRSFSTLPTSYGWFIKLAVALPTPLLGPLIKAHSSIVMSSFPGIDKHVEIMEGVKMVDMIAAGSNGTGTSGAAAYCLTTAGYQRIFLTVDELIFDGYPIPTNFNELVNQEVMELLCDMEGDAGHVTII